MDLVLIRHAIAVEPEDAPSDAERPLSGRGQKRFRKAVRGLLRLDLRLDHVFHSPWQRAAETAAMLGPLLVGDADERLEVTELLTDSPGESLLALTDRFAPETRVGFVGHEPWMGELLSLLVAGTPAHAEALAFKKGGVAWLTGTPRPGHMRLLALLPPRLLRRLAEPVAS
ncbi:SixA phosphatase family protein [Haliangium sp.]|uniref:SixA phosphatase family protein n=1 Tax=Haliangium sp. TaxID=2663208 RepID=UPI003D13F9B0